jgi:hypothetical protein
MAAVQKNGRQYRLFQGRKTDLPDRESVPTIKERHGELRFLRFPPVTLNF